MSLTKAFRLFAGCEEFCSLVHAERECGLKQGNIDRLSVAGLFTGNECCQDAVGTEHTGS